MRIPNGRLVLHWKGQSEKRRKKRNEREKESVSENAKNDEKKRKLSVAREKDETNAIIEAVPSHGNDLDLEVGTVAGEVAAEAMTGGCLRF